jgi:hypothetical protein
MASIDGKLSMLQRIMQAMAINYALCRLFISPHATTRLRANE